MRFYLVAPKKQVALNQRDLENDHERDSQSTPKWSRNHRMVSVETPVGALVTANASANFLREPGSTVQRKIARITTSSTVLAPIEINFQKQRRLV